MKYPTEDNFLKAKVYDCAECFLRLKTVNAIIEANKLFMAKGYKIKFFDCYRPLDVQKKMWQIVSNPQYVADPKKGSIHNRGGACRYYPSRQERERNSTWGLLLISLG